MEGEGGGARVREFFSQRSQILQFFFIWGGGGGGTGEEEGGGD